ncbi:hypothetical protein VW23_000850 [Devosia insulae DS-56]|uniref:Uncharacterized protein n=1 Tax=Devosia insulae DS-56 TaxID=1116389 RepID=A0A1E5XU38_9HYPH|nr:hypothetical protein [Devosia insulae]OEO32118.1 hypothetical protein VW23_000850 [Devosia insulae DS-56]
MFKMLAVAALLLAQAQPVSSPKTVEELVAASVADFRAHQTPPPTDFRAVRAGILTNADGNQQLLLCGEALVTPEEGATWLPFATLQTGGYEQWLGGHATGLCTQPGIEWQPVEDLARPMKAELAKLG